MFSIVENSDYVVQESPREYKLTYQTRSRSANISSQKRKCVTWQTALVWACVVMLWHLLLAKEEHRPSRVTLSAPKYHRKSWSQWQKNSCTPGLSRLVRRSNFQVLRELQVYWTLIGMTVSRPRRCIEGDQFSGEIGQKIKSFMTSVTLFNTQNPSLL